MPIIYIGSKKKEKVMSYYPQIIADQMKKGMSNENSKICEIGRILRDSGLSSVEVNCRMSVDKDFIPNVLSCYKGVAKRKARSSRASSHWPYVN